MANPKSNNTPAAATPEPTYQELEAIWYNKLKEQGFKDIEDVSWASSSHRLLKEWHGTIFARAEKMAERESREIYQDQIDTLLNHENFKTICKLVTKAKGRGKYPHKIKADKAAQIWELHAKGLTEREIAKELTMSRNTIHKILVRFTKWMILL